ncbi:DUF629 domain-containing protein [Cephalotus follicularis]|uniref:DUF629 domain-containing protein n=1 Tax=Cephalotus follicularis TaxID=3775 RepID=A0A1Q3BP59_CEPFO|nr:DUF629 domain-containing protein [Cephalotus follicularis]
MKFVDLNIWLRHYEELHQGVLPKELKELLPREMGHVGDDLIENVDWRPVDTSAAAKIIKTQSDFECEWPLSDNIECANILERIHNMLKVFLEQKCLRTLFA